MAAEVFSFLGPWTWWIAAAALLIAELLVPAVFFLWLAVAAVCVGLLAFVLPMSWEIEILIFSVLSAVMLVIGRPMVLNRRMADTDQPHLNRRLHGFVGRDYVLKDAIVHGRGKLRIEDAYWAVSGPDLAAGTQVTVTGVDGMTLKVEAKD